MQNFCQCWVPGTSSCQLLCRPRPSYAPALTASTAVSARTPCGEDDDGQIAALGFERPQKLKTAHARMTRSLMMMDGRKAVIRWSALHVGCGLGDGPPRTHELGEPEPCGRVVFNDQDAIAGGRGGHEGALRRRGTGAPTRC